MTHQIRAKAALKILEGLEYPENPATYIQLYHKVKKTMSATVSHHKMEVFQGSVLAIGGVAAGAALGTITAFTGPGGLAAAFIVSVGKKAASKVMDEMRALYQDNEFNSLLKGSEQSMADGTGTPLARCDLRKLSNHATAHDAELKKAVALLSVVAQEYEAAFDSASTATRYLIASTTSNAVDFKDKWLPNAHTQAVNEFKAQKRALETHVTRLDIAVNSLDVVIDLAVAAIPIIGQATKDGGVLNAGLKATSGALKDNLGGYSRDASAAMVGAPINVAGATGVGLALTANTVIEQMKLAAAAANQTDAMQYVDGNFMGKTGLTLDWAFPDLKMGTAAVHLRGAVSDTSDAAVLTKEFMHQFDEYCRGYAPFEKSVKDKTFKTCDEAVSAFSLGMFLARKRAKLEKAWVNWRDKCFLPSVASGLKLEKRINDKYATALTMDVDKQQLERTWFQFFTFQNPDTRDVGKEQIDNLTVTQQVAELHTQGIDVKLIKYGMAVANFINALTPHQYLAVQSSLAWKHMEDGLSNLVTDAHAKANAKFEGSYEAHKNCREGMFGHRQCFGPRAEGLVKTFYKNELPTSATAKLKADDVRM